MPAFDVVSSRVSFPELDAEILDYWKEREVFRRSIDDRPDAPLFMMYEGPPTANGSPGIHHVLARVFKDVISRYRTMKGCRVIRKGGWDTHGLPVELQIEQELGLSSKREIEEFGIAEFNRRCRESVFRFVKEWEVMTDRIGYWVDMDDPYVTLENDYIETGWWILKQLWDRGLLYQDRRGAPHCPRCVSSLSSHEVALGYRENTPDPSTFVTFEATEWLDGAAPDVPSYFLAWTTTPWTLPGNTALAVSADAEYSIVETANSAGETVRMALATALLGILHDDYTVTREVKGSDLTGLSYRPLYDASEYGTPIRQFLANADGLISLEDVDSYATKVVSADFVSMDDGSGIVHIAPAFGDEDLGLGREHRLAFVQPVDLQGVITGNYPFAGKFVKDADPEILADLESRGVLYHQGVYRHTYPFCWRCDTPLLYYAKTSWYIRTTAVKDQLVGNNSRINWYPEHIREGRFGEWLRNNVDWAISRERYWGTPIPIWQCDGCGEMDCVGGVDELSQRCGQELEDLDLHRPYVDDVAWPCPSSSDCQGVFRRIPEVMDCWFDSGMMPLAQWHYPFENRDIETDGRLPADYICEAVDQTRGWFYSLHALSTLLKDDVAYRNVICLGLILDGRGRKMSKRLGNIVEPDSILDTHGADALRWYLFTASHPGEPRRFSDRLVQQTLRQVLLTLWNVYSFFTNYANIDEFEPSQIPEGWRPEAELDRWILAELNQLVQVVDDHLDNYNPTDAGRRIAEFIDVLSNWYVRRSRRRFWKSENDADKLGAYATLYRCLTTVARLMAPLAPFVSEQMYRNLELRYQPDAPDSVHLSAYPVADTSLIDRPIMEATRLAIRVSSMGRAARSKAGLKVRQPLAEVVVKTRTDAELQYLGQVRPQILEELNIKELRPAEGDGDLYVQAQELAGDDGDAVVSVAGYSAALDSGYMVAVDAQITPELADEGLARELAHRIQNLRKSARFEITDRIVTYFDGPDDVARVMTIHGDYIKQETLSDDLFDSVPEDAAKSETAQIEGMEVTLGVRRANGA
ncbi:MAG: isoleucine--tRNA ligase [Chloroflexota bacterium]|nr:isoleucine--tRNA ligase [Chloroflexota bacterium]MDE2961647.1 isoleucine--tRNA ligase [Chloroflexota bacterium]